MPLSTPTPSQTPGSLFTLRWLAEHCGVAAPSTPLPRLATQMLREPECAAATRAYVAWWMRHPDEGSTFESRTSTLRELPDEAGLSLLVQQGYEGLIFECEGEIAGHVFFQHHGSELCAFSAAVTERFRGGKWSATFVLDYVAYAASIPGIQRASVGTGRNLIGRLLVKQLLPHAAGLGWRANDDGWIDFNRDGSA